MNTLEQVKKIERIENLLYVLNIDESCVWNINKNKIKKLCKQYFKNLDKIEKQYYKALQDYKDIKELYALL